MSAKGSTRSFVRLKPGQPLSPVRPVRGKENHARPTVPFSALNEFEFPSVTPITESLEASLKSRFVVRKLFTNLSLGLQT